MPPVSFIKGVARVSRSLQRRPTTTLHPTTAARAADVLGMTLLCKGLVLLSPPASSSTLITASTTAPLFMGTEPRRVVHLQASLGRSATTEHRRFYATAPSSGSGGSSSSSHHHHASDGKGSGTAASLNSSSTTGASNSSSSNSSGGTSGGSSSGSGGNGSAASKPAKQQVVKKMKAKKGKTVRRVKRKHSSTKASLSNGTASTAAAPTSATGGSTPAGGSATSNSSNSSSNHASRRASAARARAVSRRRKSQPRSAATTSAANSGHAASGAAGGHAANTSAPAAVKSKHGGAARKKMLSGKSSRDSRSGKTPIAASSSSAGTSAAATSSKAHSRSAKKLKKLRICVLSSSYDGADSATASVDNYWCTPQHYIKKDRQKYTFADVTMKKIDSYRTVRELVTSNKYDVFFNLCDGGRDEKRAGVDVVQALEEHNAAFTGTDSRSFEPSKIDMKLMVGSSGVTVPNFVLLDNDESLAKKCRHLKFPVIVKHLSGYASVGINKDNRCDSLDQLKTKVRAFIKEYNHALVEEFIRGREGTVLACADQSSPFGVKVFKPLMFNFLQNNDDFAYFEKKWTMECSDQAYSFLPSSDPAYPAIVEMARNAFKYIMNGVGYGRVDFRIDEESGVPYFLEINPNCGMWYAPKDGGDFADVMVEGDQHWNHERFVANAVARALKEQAARKPWYFISHDRNGRFSTRASKTVPEGKCLFGDAVHPIPVVSKALFKLGEEDPTVGCVICRGDGIHQAVALRHSCEPNMQFVHGRTLLFAAKRQISVGEELTVDYATLRDESMPHFVCSCGTQNCRSVIFPMPATPRTVEAKAMKRLLREKRLVWLKQKADREAERILKKRSSSSFSSSSSAGGASSSSSNAGSSVSSTNTSGSGSGGAGSSGSSSGSGSNSGNGSIK